MCRAHSKKGDVFGVVLHDLVDGEMVESTGVPSVNDSFIVQNILKGRVTTPIPSKAEPQMDPPSAPTTQANISADNAKSSTTVATTISAEEKATLIVAGQVPYTKFEQDNAIVMPCKVDGPHAIYVQILDPQSSVEFQNLEKELNGNLYPENPVPYAPQESEMVRVLYEYEGAASWYRADAKIVCEEEILAFLVDYGNFAKIPRSQVTQIIESHGRFPRVAICCSLWGMEEAENRWSAAAIDILEKQMLYQRCKLTIDKVDDVDIFHISEIMRLDDNLKIIENMVSKKMIQPFVRAKKTVIDEGKPEHESKTLIVRVNDLPVQDMPHTKAQVN